MQDRRIDSRMVVRIEGKLMSPDMAFCVDVVIRNLSETGAMISALSPAHQIPPRVYLWQAQTKTLLECKVQWLKNERLVGLHFTESCSPITVRHLIDVATQMQVDPQVRFRPVSAALHCAS